MRAPASRLAPLAILLLLAAGARAEWMQPDPSYRDAQFLLRAAIRDTAGHGAEPARLDSLGTALFRLVRFDEAQLVLRRACALDPHDRAALATLGRIALDRDQLAAADSLLNAAGDAEGADQDRYSLALRRGDWAAAAKLADGVGDGGRGELLERLAGTTAFALGEGPPQGSASMERAWPVPIINVKIGGQLVLMAIDPGAPELLIDPALVRLGRATSVPGERSLSWNGARVGVHCALVPRLEIAGLKLADVPAAVLALHRYSLDVNPEGTNVMGVIGLPVLRRFGVTLDMQKQSLELRRPGTAYHPSGQRVPFETWGESELMVIVRLNGGRKMAMQVGTGLPSAAVGAPPEVFDEVGVKAGTFSKLVKGAGVWLQGRPWTQVVVPTMALGSIVRDKAPGWSGALDASELWSDGSRRDGLLGPECFRNRRVTFDWEGHALVFEGD